MAIERAMKSDKNMSGSFGIKCLDVEEAAMFSQKQTGSRKDLMNI